MEVLRRAVAGEKNAMTHAWLFVGPPGSGRSNAAKAFAAALQCERGGCGECNECRTSLTGAHPDVMLHATEKLSIGIKEALELAGRANVAPMRSRYQVVVIEDADRLTERGADALLKSIEEPAPKSVWILCAPSADDVIVTIRSRSRELRLVTPGVDAVADLLISRDGIDSSLATHCARVAQGHVGRARALARFEDVRVRRHTILTLPAKLENLGACLRAAQVLVDASLEDAERATTELDAKEMAALQTALGFSGKGTKPRHAQAAIRELEEEQKTRAKRIQRDALDSMLTELTGYYRDVLASQTAPDVKLVNADLGEQIDLLARRTTGEQTVHALDAILEARTALEGNVAPLLAMEALMVGLARSGQTHSETHH